jgi:hypothetical protein
MNQSTKHRYVMVDIETLGTAPTSAPILEIAAVPFSVDPPRVYSRDHFYTAISYADNIACGRAPDTDTCIWWLQQKRQPVMNSSVTVLQAFTQFLAWAHRHTDEKTQWFCQGTSFDPLILQDYFDMLLLKSPWKHYQWNDCRTLQKFFSVKRPQATSHHPMDDCLNQIASIHQCHAKLPIAGVAIISSETQGKSLAEHMASTLVPINPRLAAYTTIRE